MTLDRQLGLIPGRMLDTMAPQGSSTRSRLVLGNRGWDFAPAATPFRAFGHQSNAQTLALTGRALRWVPHCQLSRVSWLQSHLPTSERFKESLSGKYISYGGAVPLRWDVGHSGAVMVGRLLYWWYWQVIAGAYLPFSTSVSTQRLD